MAKIVSNFKYVMFLIATGLFVGVFTFLILSLPLTLNFLADVKLINVNNAAIAGGKINTDTVSRYIPGRDRRFLIIGGFFIMSVLLILGSIITMAILVIPAWNIS